VFGIPSLPLITSEGPQSWEIGDDSGCIDPVYINRGLVMHHELSPKSERKKKKKAQLSKLRLLVDCIRRMFSVCFKVPEASDCYLDTLFLPLNGQFADVSIEGWGLS